MEEHEFAALDEEAIRARVRATFLQHPGLDRLFDQAFVDKAIRRRGNLHDALLPFLAIPEWGFHQRFWSSTIADLDLLAPEGAWERFACKFRNVRLSRVNGFKTELTLAAWGKRAGFSVALDVPTNGRQDCDFTLSTEPKTWWEVKSLSDRPLVRNAERALEEVKRRLRVIPEPFMLTIEPSTVALGDVAAAVKAVRREIARAHAELLPLPVSLSEHGLNITIASRTSRASGYVGLTEQAFDTDHIMFADLIRRRASEALDQLPEERAGILVIEALTGWLDEADAHDALFGDQDLMRSRDGRYEWRHDLKGVFQQRQSTRIAGVALYRRTDPSDPVEMALYHNPFAHTPVPPAALASLPGLTQYALQAEGRRMVLRQAWPPS